MSMYRITTRTVVLSAVVLASLLSQAALGQANLEVSWGSAIIQQKMILEDGSQIDPNDITIEMGSFGSFVPTEDNMGEWLSNWKVFDAVTDPDTDPNGSDYFLTSGGGSTQAKFGGSAHLISTQGSDSEDAALQNPAATFGGDEQGYVFFRTSDVMDSSSQWLLFTSTVDSDGLGLADSNWQFPTLSGSQTQFPMAWWLDQADTAIVGAINGGSGGGGTTGGGTFSDGSTNFVVRLHSIPEPRTGMLFVLLGLMALRRRRS